MKPLGRGGTGRKGFKRVRKQMGGEGAHEASRATQSKIALGYRARKTFSNMPFAFRKKTQNAFVFLVVKHHV